MKFKYIPSAAALALSVMFSSCDVTDLKPLDSMTDASFWSTTTDLELYANGLLGNLGSATIDLDANSDIFMVAGVNSYLFNTMSVNDASGWSFGVIRQCNYFMDRYQTVTGDEATINQFVGEVRFHRAQQYYGLIRRFGDVPWYEHDLKTSDTEELYKARDPRNMVLGKIIEDLEFAAKWCVESKESGRPTRDAAKTLLARACLYYGTYMKYHNEAASEGLSSEILLEKARTVSQEIISSGKYAIVKAQDPEGTMSYPEYPLNYSNLFVQTDLSSCAEAILPRYYVVDVVTHQLGRQAGGMGFGLSKAFIDMYLMENGKPIHNTGSGYKGDNTLDDEIDGRDPRLWQTIASDRRPNWKPGSGGQERWSYGSTVKSASGVTGYPCEKFHSSDFLQQQPNNSFFDWFLYRYAEVLLINAEANYELGTCTQAVLDATINQLRDRVGMAHLTVAPEADARPLDYGYTIDPLLYEIRRERAVELVNEGFRMDDLKRWNAMKLLENPMTMCGIRITQDKRDFFAKPENGEVKFATSQATTPDGASAVYEYNGQLYLRVIAPETMASEGRKWTQDDRRWLYPIPLDQLRLNENLVQNPGWPGADNEIE